MVIQETNNELKSRLAFALSILLLVSLALSNYTDVVGVYNDHIKTETRINACEANSEPGTPCFRFYPLRSESDNLLRLFLLVCSVPVLLLIPIRAIIAENVGRTRRAPGIVIAPAAKPAAMTIQQPCPKSPSATYDAV